MGDPRDLQRFVDAQARVYDDVLDELRDGCKAGHWMWFVFPQLRGLGRSAMAERYGISGREEARAYLRHPLLGARLRECTGLLLDLEGRSARGILGTPDDLKLRSCMTLFRAAAPEEALFDAVLRRYYGGEADPRTLALLAAAG
jgi:uncharacterized protein (DUF1810 family)